MARISLLPVVGLVTLLAFAPGVLGCHGWNGGNAIATMPKTGATQTATTAATQPLSTSAFAPMAHPAVFLALVVIAAAVVVAVFAVVALTARNR